MPAKPIRYHEFCASDSLRCSRLCQLCCGQTPIENTGKPMRVPFECTEADTQAAGLNCSEEEPCPVFLELSNVEAAGNKIFLAGNLHTATTTFYSGLVGQRRMPAKAGWNRIPASGSLGWIRSNSSISRTAGSPARTCKALRAIRFFC